MKVMVRASALLMLLIVAGAGVLTSSTPQPPSDYAYGGKQFGRLLADSYESRGTADPSGFYRWADSAYASNYAVLSSRKYPSMGAFLDAKRADLAAVKDPLKRASAEIDLGKRLHKFVKKTITRFSLDYGFEFCNVVKYGQRQCHLQAVLIASMLQRAGMDAGLVMVYRNITGEESNNGHAVTLVKLADGRDIIVDASEQEPFARQQGLFARMGDYRYVRPVYRANSAMITHYLPAQGSGKIPTRRVKPLDFAFVRSQFYYYRGERQQGGLVNGPETKQGLAASEHFLERSVTICPSNPLAVYMLGRAYLAEHRTEQARTTLEKANKLYKAFGWVPGGMTEYLAKATGDK